MKKTLIFLISILSLQIIAQDMPRLVTSPDEARENIQAYIKDANYKDQKRLITCSFDSKNEKDKGYKLRIGTTGENNLNITIGGYQSYYVSSSRGGYVSTKFVPHFKTTKHASDYNDFMNNFIERFVERGSSQLILNACTYDKTQWLKSVDTHNKTDVTIKFNATTRKRTRPGRILAFLGISITEFPNIAGQSYRYLYSSNDFWDDLTSLYVNNPYQAFVAAAYSEDLSGEIKIGNDAYPFTECSASKVLPHFGKK